MSERQLRLLPNPCIFLPGTQAYKDYLTTPRWFSTRRRKLDQVARMSWGKGLDVRIAAGMVAGTIHWTSITSPQPTSTSRSRNWLI